jgi:cyclopropane fatty-acyl-phospholipid synthase-like methyltransferase
MRSLVRTLSFSSLLLSFLSLVATLVAGCGPSSPPPSTAHAHGDHHGHEGHDGHGPLVHRFERADDWVKEFDDPARDAWQKPASVIALMNVSAGMTVVDLGAGTGYFLPHLSKAAGASGKVLALDVEPDMVRYMTERATREKLANVTAKVIALDDPQLPAGTVDRVLVVDTWHHVANRKVYAAKLLAALAPKGAVYVVDFTAEASHGPPKQHRLAPELVVEELRAGGMTAEIVAEDLPEQYVVVGRR